MRALLCKFYQWFLSKSECWIGLRTGVFLLEAFFSCQLHFLQFTRTINIESVELNGCWDWLAQKWAFQDEKLVGWASIASATADNKEEPNIPMIPSNQVKPPRSDKNICALPKKQDNW